MALRVSESATCLAAGCGSYSTRQTPVRIIIGYGTDVEDQKASQTAGCCLIQSDSQLSMVSLWSGGNTLIGQMIRYGNSGAAGETTSRNDRHGSVDWCRVPNTTRGGYEGRVRVLAGKRRMDAGLRGGNVTATLRIFDFSLRRRCPG